MQTCHELENDWLRVTDSKETYIAHFQVQNFFLIYTSCLMLSTVVSLRLKHSVFAPVSVISSVP